MTNQLILPALLLAGLLACGTDKTAVKTAEKDVFALHDDVMPITMGTFPTLQKQLEARLTALDSLKSAGVLSQVQLGEEREQIARIRRQLSLADSSMNAWMENYNSDTLEKISTVDALNYLEQEKIKMTAVKQRTNTALTDAKAYLKDK